MSELHPWKSAQDEFEQSVLPKLKKYGKAIGKDASDGSLIAMGIINYYGMLRKSFDPMTLTLLQASLNDWKATTREVLP